MFRGSRTSSQGRARWAAVGAAVAVSLGAGGVGWLAHADTPASTFVGIAPCRLFDTRPAPDGVGDRRTPLAAGEELTRQVRGANGNCNIPANATAIAYNLTVPTSINGFLTIFPADAPRPTSSSINPVAGEQVKANSGIVALSATGAIKLYTLSGPVNAILDITGYYTAAGGSSGGIDVSHANRTGPVTLSTGSGSIFMSLSPEGTGAVTLASPGRLVVDAAITLGNIGSTGTLSRIECSMRATPGNIAIGLSQVADVEGDNGRLINMPMSLVGSVEVPAGSYNVDVSCIDNLRTGASQPRVERASMTVTAVPN